MLVEFPKGRASFEIDAYKIIKTKIIKNNYLKYFIEVDC